LGVRSGTISKGRWRKLRMQIETISATRR
jgi:hypothetical protein